MKHENIVVRFSATLLAATGPFCRVRPTAVCRVIAAPPRRLIIRVVVSLTLEANHIAARYGGGACVMSTVVRGRTEKTITEKVVACLLVKQSARVTEEDEQA